MINQRTSTPDWANRWVGGFCAPGMYGGPIRAADYRTPVTLTQSLPLPAHLTESHAPSRTSLAPGLLPTLWSQLVGEAAVVLVKNVRQARALLLDGLTRTPQPRLPCLLTPVTHWSKRSSASVFSRSLPRWAMDYS